MTEFISRNHGHECYEIIIKTTNHEHYKAAEDFARRLIDHAKPVTDNNVGCKWIPASEPPKEYRNEYNELKCFLVCVDGTEEPFRAMYDGKTWGDGVFAIPVKWWMPLPEPPEEVNP